MNKKILISLSVIGAVAAIAIGGTIAYFSDVETSTGNTFTAGSLDLKVDNTCHYNGKVCEKVGNDYFWSGTSEPCSCTWEETDLTNQLFFNFTDVKPGDTGEDTISLKSLNNDAWLCAYVKNLANKENGCTEPEGKTDPNCGNPGVGEGELQNNIFMTIWRDTNCDNIQDQTEDILVSNVPIDSNNGVWPLYAPILGGVPLPGNTKVCLGVKWDVPPQTGNIIQGDNVTGDISFYAEQARNNQNFVCPPNIVVKELGNVSNPSTKQWTAEARHGKPGNQDWEVGVGTNTQQAGQFDNNIGETDFNNWPQGPTAVPFTLTYNSGTGMADFTVDGVEKQSWNVGVISASSKMYIRVAASSGANDSSTLKDLVVDGNTLPDVTVGSGGANVVEVSGLTLTDGFTMTGNSVFYYSGTSGSRPAYQIHIGY